VPTVLDGIISGVREDLGRRRAALPVEELESRLAHVAPALDPMPGIRAAEGVAVIAEVKRSSPSKGALADIPAPGRLARSYAAAMSSPAGTTALISPISNACAALMGSASISIAVARP